MRTPGVARKTFFPILGVLPVLAVIACVWSDVGCRRGSVPPQATIRGKTWFVELATTDEQHEKGLSDRTELAGDAGMLFIFPDSAIRLFWMKNCYIPLDIAFIDEHRKVVGMGTMAVEADFSGKMMYSSQVPIKYALEVSGGALAATGVQVGDEVTFRGDIPR
jgi:uncharacterized membrane protein (UPF0127 family)